MNVWTSLIVGNYKEVFTLKEKICLKSYKHLPVYFLDILFTFLKDSPFHIFKCKMAKEVCHFVFAIRYV